MFFYKPLIYAILFVVLQSDVFAETLYSQIDERLLLNPNPLLVKQERAGKVIIYDRVREEIIHNALDNNFARIENMMFINTLVEEDDGDLQIEEDDCD